jgi:hypothetical protein
MLTEGGETITFATQATLRESKRVDWVHGYAGAIRLGPP